MVAFQEGVQITALVGCGPSLHCALRAARACAAITPSSRKHGHRANIQHADAGAILIPGKTLIAVRSICRQWEPVSWRQGCWAPRNDENALHTLVQGCIRLQAAAERWITDPPTQPPYGHLHSILTGLWLLLQIHAGPGMHE